MSTTVVSNEEVLHVAALANLALTEEEVPRMARDLNAILVHIEQLKQLDTIGVEPMAQVADVLGLEGALSGEQLRRDVVQPSVDRAAVMHEAPETDGRFFKVPKVIER
jgi:aspartyl-tRNA(Asn)/glutamyl-tRNA(Gln) amidotransferase subunit C